MFDLPQVTLPKGKWFGFSVDVLDGKLKIDLRIIGPAQPPMMVPAPGPLGPVLSMLNGCGISVDAGDANGNGKPDVTLEVRVKGKTFIPAVTVDIPIAQALDGFELVAGLLPEPGRFMMQLAAKGLRSVVASTIKT